MHLTRSLTLGLFTATLLLLGVADVTYGLSLPQITTHDFVSDGSKLHVSGPDPYLTFEPYTSESNGQFLQLNLRIDNLPESLDPVPFELFFSASSSAPHVSSNDLVFDPRYRLRIQVPRSQFMQDETWFTVPLPEVRPRSAQFRLDFERCDPCSVTVLSHPKVVLTASNDILLADVTRVYNGVRRLDKDRLTLPLTGWDLHDMEGDLTGLSSTGLDPFITSPVIDLSTEELGGIVVTLSRALAAASDYLDFQLFYATERHGFRADASTLVRLETDLSNQYRFFIPLRFLSEERPNDQIVERIRIDFLPEASNNLWHIKEIMAISKDTLADYEALTPALILVNKQQRAGKRQLLLNVVTKITTDLPFTLFYLILLIGTSAVVWRRFKP